MRRFNILLFVGLVAVCGGPVLPEKKDDSYHDPDNMLQCQNTTVIGIDGKPVTLPCSRKDKMDISLDKIEWFFKDPTTGEDKNVHTYYQRKDQLQRQSEEFKGRTSLFKEELSSGNCSLRLNGTTSHNGSYQCRVASDGKPHFCLVNLEVLPKGDSSGKRRGVTESPDKPNNGQTAIYWTLAVVGVVGVIAGVGCWWYKRRKRQNHRKRNRSGGNSNSLQTPEEVPLQDQQPPENEGNEPADQDPQEQMLMDVIVDQGDPTDGNVRSRSHRSSEN